MGKEQGDLLVHVQETLIGPITKESVIQDQLLHMVLFILPHDPINQYSDCQYDQDENTSNSLHYCYHRSKMVLISDSITRPFMKIGKCC